MGTNGLTEQLGSWTVERLWGPASQLFGQSIVSTGVRTARVLTVERPTLVLGSSQSSDLVDLAFCAAHGIDVVQRRSGGGAVWLDIGLTWVDVFLPFDDPLSDADVGRAMWWVGDTWADALRAAQFDRAVTYKGPLVRNQWSSLVCFAGLGPGEVSLGERKVVGISQRRTRAGSLFQCGLLRSWSPELLLRALSIEEVPSELQSEALGAPAGVGERSAVVLQHFLGALSER